MITGEDFLRRGHILLESHEGRKQVFELIEDSLKKGINDNRHSDFLWAVSKLDMLLTGEGVIFVDSSLPNLPALRSKRPEMKKEALGFLSENLEYLTRGTLRLLDSADDLYYPLWIIFRFLPDLEKKEAGRLADLYLCLLHTVAELEFLKGSDRERESLKDLLLKASFRYNCVKLVSGLLRKTGWKDELEQLSTDSSLGPEERHISLFKGLYEAGKSLMKDEESSEASGYFAPLVFTDTIFFSLIINEVKEERTRILEFLAERVDDVANYIKSRYSFLEPLRGERIPGSVYETLKERISKWKETALREPLKKQEDYLYMVDTITRVYEKSEKIAGGD